MGAVFLLVLLPLVAVMGFLLKTIQGEAQLGGLLAAAVCVFLAYVITSGALTMARGWDAEEADR